MASFGTVTVLFLGIFNGLALGQGSVDSILNADGMFGSVLSSNTVQGADPMEGLSKTLNDPVKLNQLYSKYQSAFGKSGSLADNSAQKSIFKSNLLKIAGHNIKARNGEATYEMGVNKFTDMSFSEVVKKFTGYKADNSSQTPKSSTKLLSRVLSKRDSPPPNAVDWRDYGLVTPVKDQGQCGSCVLFSTTGCLESYYALTHGQQRGQLDLSEQELLDCDNGPPNYSGNHGCNGNGFPDTFKYLKNIGLSLESDYRYTARQGSCQGSSKSHPAKVKSTQAVAARDENALKNAVGKFGPVSIALCVTDSFQAYHSGIYTGPCSGNRNHAVLAVGYGSENGRDYWIIKNSWSDRWGDRGYIKIGRNMNNLCDVAGDAMICSDVAIAIA